jgi:ankyrin repeat protein
MKKPDPVNEYIEKALVDVDNWELHFAAQKGDTDKICNLIIAGYSINCFDELGKTPLHYAAESESIDAIKILLAAGAHVNALDLSRAGDTPLGSVAQRCSYEVAKLLLTAGADPTLAGSGSGTPLERAAKRKKPEGRKVYELMKYFLGKRNQLEPVG